MPVEYRSFVPDAEAESRVRATFTRLRAQRRTDAPPACPALAHALETADPRDVFEHAETLLRRDDVLEAAVEADCVAILRLRLDGLRLRCRMSRLVPIAGRRGADSVLRFLCERGISPNVRDTSAKRASALHYAVHRESLSSLHTLLSLPGIDLSVCDAWGDSPIEHAVRHARWDAAVVLAAAGSRLRARWLVHAILKSGPLDLLLDACPQLDATDGITGLTPLHAAVAIGDIANAQSLLVAGAKLDIKAPRTIECFGTTVPKGTSVLDLMRMTGADVHFRSWVRARPRIQSGTRWARSA